MARTTITTYSCDRCGKPVDNSLHLKRIYKDSASNVVSPTMWKDLCGKCFHFLGAFLSGGGLTED
jgi:hypothetical protein